MITPQPCSRLRQKYAINDREGLKSTLRWTLFLGVFAAFDFFERYLFKETSEVGGTYLSFPGFY